MPYEIIGRKTYQVGKPLWEIIGSLKNFGVGRMFVRGTQKNRYREPCYYRILHAEPMAPEGEVRRVKVTADRVFRGEYLGQEEISLVTFKPDFQLVPKTEEGLVSGLAKGELPPNISVNFVMPRTAPLPVLLRELIYQDQEQSGKPIEEPIMDMKYIIHKNSKFRIAEPGEEPMMNINYKVKPKRAEMYDKVVE